MPQIEGAPAPKSRSRETKRETALKTALAHAEAELQHPDLMVLGEAQGGRAPMLISERFWPCMSHDHCLLLVGSGYAGSQSIRL